MQIETDLIAGGYSLTRPVATPEFLPGELLPTTIFSAGQCTAGVPGIVPWASGEPKKLGVPPEKIDSLNEWVDKAFEIEFGYPDTFYTLDAARNFVQQFIPKPPSDLMIICTALPRNIAEEFIRTEVKAIGERGIYQKFRRREAPAPGGIHLGFEPIGFGYDLDHTWLCYEDLVREGHKLWGVKPNNLGFIDDLDDANKVVDIANEGIIGNCLWLAWSILRYPISE